MSRKDRKAEETIRIIDEILSKNDIKYNLTSQVNNCDSIFSVRVEIDNGLGIAANGKGITYELALASGLAELMERLQSRNSMKFWYSTKYYPKTAFECEWKSVDLLEGVIKETFAKFVGGNLYCYRMNYLNEVTKEKTAMPNRLVNLLCGSNGLCAGNSREEAIVQGVSEVFERHIRKCISKNHLKCPFIKKSEIQKYKIKEKLIYIEKQGLEWEVLDCTDEGKYPVIGLMVLDRSMSRCALVLGADVDFEIALERCITELLQGRSIENLRYALKRIDFINACEKEMFWSIEEQSDYYDFIDNYISNSGNNPFYLFLKDENSAVSIPRVFRTVDSNKQAYFYILEILEKNKLELYVGDFSYLGFPTYRVFIPELSIIFEINNKSYRFVDNLYDNMKKITSLDFLDIDEKEELLSALVDLSTSYVYRRSPFSDILFRFCGDKDFDFNFLYLDFVIALLYMSKQEYKNAFVYYKRFVKEHNIFRENSQNELLKVIYVYLNELSCDKNLEEIYTKYRFLFNNKTNQYVYESFKRNRCLDMVYWPKCPDCRNCSYNIKCLYGQWEQLNQVLREKQKQYYEMEDKTSMKEEIFIKKIKPEITECRILQLDELEEKDVEESEAKE